MEEEIQEQKDEKESKRVAKNHLLEGENFVKKLFLFLREWHLFRIIFVRLLTLASFNLTPAYRLQISL